MKLAAFEGDWLLRRRITDGSGTARFAGAARFTPAGDHYSYLETGVLHLPGGAAFAAERGYLFREGPGGVDVRFSDGRAFHSFEWTAPEAEHLCPPDLYRVRYDLGRWPRWRAVWHVTGPRKAYTLVSAYRRP